jgi:hypothetical protein
MQGRKFSNELWKFPSNNISINIMKKTQNILLGLLMLTACSSAGTATITVPAPSTPTAIQALPTSAAPGTSILWEELQVTMDQSEITRDFINEFGSTRNPSSGQKFLWVHVQLKNVGGK